MKREFSRVLLWSWLLAQSREGTKAAEICAFLAPFMNNGSAKVPGRLMKKHLVSAGVAALLVCVAGAATAAPSRQLQGHVPPAAQASPPVSRVAAGARLDLAIGLPIRNEAALTDLLHRLYDPSSPDYHQYLTPDKFTELFGPTEADYEAVIDFVKSKSLIVTRTHANRLLLEVNGEAGDIERAFNVHLNLYRHPMGNRTFFAPDSEPSVDAGVPVLDISGLNNYLIPHPMSLRPMPAPRHPGPNLGSGSGGSFAGGDFRAAYAPGVTLDGTGQTLGLLEFDGYYSSDITTYETQAGLPNVTLQNVLLNNFKGSAGANNVEVALDIEVAISMAPSLSKVMVYEGTLPNTILNQMAIDNQAKQLSSSWSFTINGTTESIYRQLAAQGQTMFQASGDDGAYSGTVSPPSDDPNLTVVGGTTLATTGPGGRWVSETTWNWANTGSGTNASGGGISMAYTIPSWQQGISMSANQGSTTMRNIPDVALTADNIMVVFNKGSTGIFGGTSAAAPLWAGFMALVNQQALAGGKPTVGFLNPTLYSFATGPGYASGFHDVATGNNTNASSPKRFFAAAGYDLCTGWGTPAGQSLIDALSGNSAPVFTTNPFKEPTVNVGQAYSATISTNASDANPSATLTFAKLSGPTWLNVAADGTLSGTAANSDAGTNTFVVSVADSGGLSNTATMYLNVNGAPSFTSNPLIEPTANAGQAYSISIANMVTDPNPGDTLTLAKVSGAAWLSVASNGAVSGTPANANAGTNTFVVSVTDSGGLSNTATMYIDVNGAPIFTSNPFTEPTATAGRAYSASIATNATDPNPGATLTFAKVSGPAWLSVAGSGSVSGTPANANAGTNTFVVSVSDSGGLSNTATMYISVNGAPSFTSNPFTEPTANAGQPYSGSISNQATDPNPGDILTFAKVSGPSWLSVAGDGSITGTPASADAGTNSFIVSVTDTGGLSNSATMNVTVMVQQTPIKLQIAGTGTQLSLSWTGGNAPFQVQMTTNLVLPNWQDFGNPTTNSSFSLTASNAAAFYRIKGR